MFCGIDNTPRNIVTPTVHCYGSAYCYVRAYHSHQTIIYTWCCVTHTMCYSSIVQVHALAITEWASTEKNKNRTLVARRQLMHGTLINMAHQL